MTILDFNNLTKLLFLCFFYRQHTCSKIKKNKLIATLDSTIDNSKNENEKANASKEKERILGYMEKEVAIESAAKSKNLPDVFVMVTQSNVAVTVDKQELPFVKYPFQVFSQGFVH